MPSKIKKEFCTKCGKPNDGAHALRCKACMNEYSKSYNKSRDFPYRKSIYLKHKFGVSFDDVDQMLKAQDHKCAICFTTVQHALKRNDPIAAHLDHNHVTNQVRQLLCRHCNFALGHVKDNVNILKQMVKYLEQHNAK